ncbi:hypothetical protein [Priestia sp. TGN 0903]|uniref:hypothetical protein n=1 Tax=Priestia sp. TGN 0903 TaxID=3420730 RepID=UPI003D771A81
MDQIKGKVQEKLLDINQIPFDNLDAKTQERLIEVEKFIQEREKEAQDLVKRIQKLKVTKTSITNSPATNFTRKTLYNDSILKDYVEYSIKHVPDYFNESKITNFRQKINDIQNQYEKILYHITKENVIELQNEKMQEDLQYLLTRNDELHKILIEKEITIKTLQEKHIPKNIPFTSGKNINIKKNEEN